MNHLAINLLIRAAAGRFSLVVSEKFLSQAVPVAGAVAGGALNYAFTDSTDHGAGAFCCALWNGAPASRGAQRLLTVVRAARNRATSAGGHNAARYFSCPLGRKGRKEAEAKKLCLLWARAI